MKHFFSVAKTFLPKSSIISLMILGTLLGVTFLAPVALGAPLQFPSQYPDIEAWNDVPQAYTAGQVYTLHNIVDIIGEIRNFVLIVGIIIVLIFLIWGGISYMTAGGDATKIATAKSRIVAAIIGAAVVIGAFAILATIKGILDARTLL